MCSSKRRCTKIYALPTRCPCTAAKQHLQRSPRRSGRARGRHIRGQGQLGLWVSNGTAAGTFELTGISGANTSNGGLEPVSLTLFNAEVMFNGQDASGSQNLWVTNGTAAGTFELTGISGAYTGGLSLQARDDGVSGLTGQSARGVSSTLPSGRSFIFSENPSRSGLCQVSPAALPRRRTPRGASPLKVPNQKFQVRKDRCLVFIQNSEPYA
jgi:hypothetical protein